MIWTSSAAPKAEGNWIWSEFCEHFVKTTKVVEKGLSSEINAPTEHQVPRSSYSHTSRYVKPIVSLESEFRRKLGYLLLFVWKHEKWVQLRSWFSPRALQHPPTDVFHRDRFQSAKQSELAKPNSYRSRCSEFQTNQSSKSESIDHRLLFCNANRNSCFLGTSKPLAAPNQKHPLDGNSISSSDGRQKSAKISTGRQCLATKCLKFIESITSNASPTNATATSKASCLSYVTTTLWRRLRCRRSITITPTPSQWSRSPSRPAARRTEALDRWRSQVCPTLAFSSAWSWHFIPSLQISSKRRNLDSRWRPRRNIEGAQRSKQTHLVQVPFDSLSPRSLYAILHPLDFSPQNFSSFVCDFLLFLFGIFTWSNASRDCSRHFPREMREREKSLIDVTFNAAASTAALKEFKPKFVVDLKRLN